MLTVIVFSVKEACFPEGPQSLLVPLQSNYGMDKSSNAKQSFCSKSQLSFWVAKQDRVGIPFASAPGACKFLAKSQTCCRIC